MNLFDYFADINTFVFDVDGVLTNNRLLVTEEGQLLREMNARDGYAMQLAIKQGYRVAIITGGRSEGVKIRLQRLGITDIYTGISDKNEAYADLYTKWSLNPDTVLYMGDDMPDIPVMQKVALPCAPADACPQVLKEARYVSPLAGGNGCVRDVIEKVLTLHGKWQ